jgi:hypothetical protein
MTIRGTIQSKQGLIGKVVNSPVNRTSISSPNFKPTANVAMSDITDVQFTTKANGDILIYNSSSEKFELNKLTAEQIGLQNINGGRF